MIPDKTQIRGRLHFAPGKRRMSANQFEAIRPFLTQLNPERAAAAQMALLEVLPMLAIAAHLLMSQEVL